jgi:hypothetical protein
MNYKILDGKLIEQKPWPYTGTVETKIKELDSIDFARKLHLIFDNIHKFSYDEIHKIFTEK